MEPLSDEQWERIKVQLPQDLLLRPRCKEKKCERTCNNGCNLQSLVSELDTEVHKSYENTMRRIMGGSVPLGFRFVRSVGFSIRPCFSLLPPPPSPS